MVRYLQFVEDVARQVQRELPQVQVTASTQYGGPAREFHVEEKSAVVRSGPLETSASIWADDYSYTFHLDEFGPATVDSAVNTIVQFFRPKPPELPQI